MAADVLATIPGLLEADDPSGWAYSNLDCVGQGHHALVYAHPTRDDVVVRVAPFPEGYFGYAVPMGDEAASPHFPRYHDIVLIDDVLIGACERLEPIEEQDVEIRGWIEVARMLAFGDIPSPGRLEAFRMAQPGFERFLEERTQKLTDLRDENWMLRGKVLVLNDPISMMPKPIAERIEAEFRIDRLAPSAPSPS